MSPERTDAYRRVLQVLEDLGPSKLQDDEVDRIRYAADSLVLTTDLDSDDAIEAIAEIRLMLDHLVDSGRWSQESADKLNDDILACGPQRELVTSA
ncbi:MAG: hypothetical protein J2O48_08760 [Solirubrobacterales bacterium]|nr:hypothetical protein [Solirubrobacterales bacterium]